MHKSQIFLYFILAFILGVGVASIFIWPYFVSGVLIGAGLFLVALFWRRKWVFVVAGISLVFFICGVLRYNTVKLDQGILTQFTDKLLSGKDGKTVGLKVTIVGYIKDEPHVSGDKQVFTVATKQLIVPNYVFETSENVQVSVRIYPEYRYGQAIKVLGTINTPNDDDSDSYKNYLSKDGIFTTMLYPEIEDTQLELSWWQRRRLNLFGKIFIVKNAFETSLSRSISEPSSSFVGGILLGTRSQIPKNIKDAFARTSLTHVLAISGYNVTIIANILVAFLLWFMRRQRAFWFAVGMIFVFTIMTGAQASVVRAALMGILVLLARHQGRFYNVKNAIALAAGIMIFANPLVLTYDVGFQLSFMATLGLVFLSPQLEEVFDKFSRFLANSDLGKKSRIFDFITRSMLTKSGQKSILKETLIMTISAQILVLPLLIYYFGNFSVISIPANLIILPTIPVTMLLGFIAGVAGLITPILGQIVGYFAWCLATIQLRLVLLFATLSWASVAIIFTAPMVVVSYLLLFTLVFREKIKEFKRVK